MASKGSQPLVRVRGQPFVFGLLPCFQLAKLEPLRFRGLLDGGGFEGQDGNVNASTPDCLPFDVWAAWAERHCGLPRSTAWLYFDTYDVVGVPSPSRRRQFARLQTLSHPAALATAQSRVEVDTVGKSGWSGQMLVSALGDDGGGVFGMIPCSHFIGKTEYVQTPTTTTTTTTTHTHTHRRHDVRTTASL
jgi:hypothetical protein